MSRYEVNVLLYRLKKDASFRARFLAGAPRRARECPQTISSLTAR